MSSRRLRAGMEPKGGKANEVVSKEDSKSQASEKSKQVKGQEG